MLTYHPLLSERGGKQRTRGRNRADARGEPRLGPGGLARWEGPPECPNAGADRRVEEAFQRTDRHADWRVLDPRNTKQMARLAAELELGPRADPASMQSVLRLFYGTESVGPDRFDLYSLHREITAIDARLRVNIAREPPQWELVSALVRAAAEDAPETPRLAALARADQRLEEACQKESLGAESRLGEQVYRLSARLCVDGCQGCLHTGGALMPEALAEPAVSRRVLERLTADRPHWMMQSSQAPCADPRRTESLVGTLQILPCRFTRSLL